MKHQNDESNPTEPSGHTEPSGQHERVIIYTDGAAEPQIEERRVAELWTFERTLGASDPNWVLARTEPAAA